MADGTRLMVKTDIVIVGAGPAGLSAALRAADAGAAVTVVDEYVKPGGQYFRQPQAQFGRVNAAILGKSYKAGKALIDRVANNDRITLMTGTLVWGGFGSGVLEVERDNQCERIASERIIIATGAYERPIPFPGWTLPGVTTAGAAQTLLKAQFILAGRRIVLSGSGPFQLPVATQLLKAGAEIVEILETVGAGEFFKPFPQPWRHLDKLEEAARYFATLLAHSVPLRFRQAVVEARGDDRVEEAVIAPLDADGRALLDKTRTVAVDAILVNSGFMPSLQIPRLLGCETRWDAQGSCWVVACDGDQRSSTPHVFVAGEATGVAGHRVALAEGEIAGLHAAADLGYLMAEELAVRLRQPRADRERHQSFADHVKQSFTPRAGRYDSIAGDTIVCRCEEVTAAAILGIAAEWGGSLRAVKQCTRAGMGQCQGRICEATVARLAARASGRPLDTIGHDTARPQVKPVSLKALAESVLES